MLADAEKLATEWKTQRSATPTSRHEGVLEGALDMLGRMRGKT
jgi:hypothetical protein